MQTLSLFPTPLFTNKQAPTFKASAASEGVSTFTAPSRLLQDTVSFSATPKIRSGATADRQLSDEEVALIGSVISPYRNILSEPNASFSTTSLKKALKEELPFNILGYERPASAYDFVKPAVLMAKFFSEEVRKATDRAIRPLDPEHPALKACQQEIERVEGLLPARPSDELLNVIFQPDQKKQFLTAYNGSTIASKKEAVKHLSEVQIGDRDFLLPSISQFEANVDEWVFEVDWAEEKLRQEKLLLNRLQDLTTFREAAEKAGLLEAFDDACTKHFASTLGIDKVEFSSLFKKPIAQYEAMLKNTRIWRTEPLPASLVDYEFFGLFKAVFSENRQKNVKQVLRLFETKPKAVEAVIQKLKAVKV
jgi:hypothetical protein